MTLSEQIRDAESEVARLKRVAGSATCAEMGAHDWRHIGGASCCCNDGGGCSVPVYECSRCKDCDYGDNAEAIQVRRECAEAEAADRRCRHQVANGRAWLAARPTPPSDHGAAAPRDGGTALDQGDRQ